MSTCVWAFQRLPELNNQLEFVECDEELAARLIAAGKAQDPRIGGTALKEVTYAPPVTPPAPAARKDAEYDTKVMTPKQPPRNVR